MRYYNVSWMSVLKVSDPDWDGTRRWGVGVVDDDVQQLREMLLMMFIWLQMRN